VVLSSNEANAVGEVRHLYDDNLHREAFLHHRSLDAQLGLRFLSTN
jgi:hypothetical protein